MGSPQGTRTVGGVVGAPAAVGRAHIPVAATPHPTGGRKARGLSGAGLRGATPALENPAIPPRVQLMVAVQGMLLSSNT